ncbi:unnamed protein product [Lepeophtheirus salmonis]|uniref:(salmon louse) hypothetical protein n=1 Tax=Lepeophtheirus salmonis TaxID=72036 RepID=A0A7R8GZC1_LEPSM|nr:unnamed protein product [Lepeophtheirus salmonis]CAF2763358.1 unnamed protein product [Lepeophtheirus salmonis]
MGSHQEANDNEVSTSSGGGGGTNATISGSTASIGVLSLILAIISVAVPHWGSYFLGAQSYNDYSGHFGPFQTCRYYIGGISDCHGQTAFRSSTWIFAAGIVAICTVVAIGVFVLFSILHVAMQLQRKSIWLKDIRTALFIKLVSSSIAVIGCVVAIGLSSWEFEIAKRKKHYLCAVRHMLLFPNSFNHTKYPTCCAFILHVSQRRLRTPSSSKPP